MFEGKLEFPEGRGDGYKTKNLPSQGGIDIFWNRTLVGKANFCSLLPLTLCKLYQKQQWYIYKKSIAYKVLEHGSLEF